MSVMNREGEDARAPERRGRFLWHLWGKEPSALHPIEGAAAMRRRIYVAQLRYYFRREQWCSKQIGFIIVVHKNRGDEFPEKVCQLIEYELH